MAKYKTCRDCARLRNIHEFSTNKRAADGYQPYCRPCMNVRIKASRTYYASQRKGLFLKIQYDQSRHPHKGYPCLCADKWCSEGIGPKDRCECRPSMGCTVCARAWILVPESKGGFKAFKGKPGIL